MAARCARHNTRAQADKRRRGADHDTLDGMGSYPPELQQCPVLQLILAQSQRFYLLFQHATTPAHAAGDGYIVNPGAKPHEPGAFHFVTQCGPSLLVVAPDSRSQRSREHILKKESYQRIEAAVRATS
jgi:PhoD related phosphatase